MTAVKEAIGRDDFKKAIDFHERLLTMAKEDGDRSREGKVYAGLSMIYYKLGDFKKAIDLCERRLKIAKEQEDKTAEGCAYGNLGACYDSLGDFRNAIHYHELCLKSAKDRGDRPVEGRAFGNLGAAYNSLGDFTKAIDYNESCLKIAKEMKDRSEEGRAYGCLGVAYNSLGDLKKAIDYLELNLKVAKEVKDRYGEGRAYGNLGEAYRSLGDLKKAKDYFELSLKIAKEIEDRHAEGRTYGRLGKVYESLGELDRAIDYNERFLIFSKEVKDRFGEGRAFGQLGNAYCRLGDYPKGIGYHEIGLKIAREVGDKFGEGCAYGDLGRAYFALGDIQKAIQYHKHWLETANQMDNVAQEGIAYANLGFSYESLGSLQEALDCFQNSVKAFNNVRARLQSKDEWKIDLRDMTKNPYTGLWRVLLNLGRSDESLCAAEKGRAQALNDLMESSYGIRTADVRSITEEETIHDILSDIQCSTSFAVFHEGVINFWVIQRDKDICRRVKKVGELSTRDDVISSVQNLVACTFEDIGVRAGVNCEDRSLNKLRKPSLIKENSDQTQSHSSKMQRQRLRELYDAVIDPIADTIQGDELIIVPEGPLWLAPYAAFMDSNSNYLCESFRIRVIPSLTSLKLILDCPADHHSRTGALLVGDPWVQEVTSYNLCQLPFARKEVKKIGEILHTLPLTEVITGTDATKDEVLKRLSSVALVHIAAHGNMETGEIALAPNPTRASREPEDKDFLLTMSDVLNVKLRAKLVVLSCCHSGRGEIKAEGVVGIARAFLGAGARSVLVSLWAIDDEATLEFMKNFYQHLVEGRRASEALNRAMKHMRESDKFSEVKYWAPFVLIGDDVTLEFPGGQ